MLKNESERMQTPAKDREKKWWDGREDEAKASRV